MPNDAFIELTAEIVAAHVSNNTVPLLAIPAAKLCCAVEKQAKDHSAIVFDEFDDASLHHETPKLD